MTAISEASALEYVLARAADAEAFERWRLQGRSARWCAHPVRLAGSTTTVDTASGEVLARYSTTGEPDRLLVKACSQRRATACPQCAEVYRADAWHLIASGLRGGKGMPESVAGHHMVFVTLTAPSFGAVHSRRERGGRARPCRTGARGRCAHGRPRRCQVLHPLGDERLGEPLCAGCFDYRAAVLWNALATELWRRTTIGLTRALARLAGVSQTELVRSVRLSFTKVVEYQRRGVVHLHAVIRLDGPDGPDSPPRLPIPATLLEVATRQAAASARVAYPAGAGVNGRRCGARRLTFGRSLLPGRARRQWPPTSPSTPPNRPTASAGWTTSCAPATWPPSTCLRTSPAWSPRPGTSVAAPNSPACGCATGPTLSASAAIG